MRIIIALFLFASFALQAQEKSKDKSKWRIDKNKIITGSLVFVAGGAKGFNETIQFNYKIFEKTFPGANKPWFDPKVSWRNKYEGGNPDNGAKSFLSTSVFVMFTDQYHLNNFINKLGWTSAIVFRIGEKKQPFKYYLLDALYYTLCHQLGFALTYLPFKNYQGN